MISLFWVVTDTQQKSKNLPIKAYNSKSYDPKMVKMVLKVAPWSPLDNGQVKTVGLILSPNWFNMSDLLKRKGKTYLIKPHKTLSYFMSIVSFAHN